MELINCVPWIRFADVLRFTEARGPSKTYDSRLLYVKKGKVRLTVEGEHYTMTHGCLFLFQPGTAYTLNPEEKVTMAVFDFDFTPNYSSREEYLPPCQAARFRPELAHQRVEFSDAPALSGPLFLENGQFLESVITEIITEFLDKRALYRSKCSALFKNLLCDIARSQLWGDDGRDVMGRIFRYVDLHIDQRITNAQLGQALSYNPNYLNRLVLRHTGMSLHQYVLQRRLAMATTMLTSTEKPISEIAVGLGFHSPSHFSNFFKQATGMTPAQCRKNHIL